MALSAGQLSEAMAAFTQPRLTGALEKTDWVNSPAIFTEQLTTHLWTTHQIDAFRAAAVEYVGKSSAALPEEPLPTHRLGIVVIGQGVGNNPYRLFREIRPQGTYFTTVTHADGLNTLASAVAKRAAAHPLPYGHWYIDGGASAAAIPNTVARVSYVTLSPVRAALQSLTQKFYEARLFDPDAFRTRLAQTTPEEIGLN